MKKHKPRGKLRRFHVPLLECLLDLSASLLASVGGLQRVALDTLQVDLRNSVTSRHDVVVVDEFEERLDSGALQNLIQT